MSHNYSAPIYELISASDVQPITVKQVADLARLSKNMVRKQSNLLTMIIGAVVECAELWTRREFINKQWRYVADFFPVGNKGNFGFSAFPSNANAAVLQPIELRKSILRSIEEVQYTDLDGNIQVIDAANYYQVNSPDFGCVMNDPDLYGPRM